MDRDGHDPEWRVRKQRIDPILDSLGWSREGAVPAAGAARVEEYETANGPADYALGLDGKVLGVVEAKKLTLGPQNVLTQAERYSKGATSNPLNFNGYHVPFLYSTNGEVIWFYDARHPLNRSRKVSKFHNAAAFREMMTRDLEADLQKLRALPNNHKRLRPYQIDANAAIEKGIADRKHAMLVAMATGTGKTFTLTNQIYRLMKSGVARRVLFLVDRRALAAQAVRAFKSFEPEPGLKFHQLYELFSQKFQLTDFEGDDEKFDVSVLPSHYLTDPKPGNDFVYVCTIQRMAMNLFGHEALGRFGGERETEDDADRLPIPIHAFDVIIADECHRGYTAQEVSVWRDTLNHFDAIKIGLTATPATHTTAYFGHPIYRYDYERAVREGFLVDYDVVKINSDVRLKGVFLQEGERVGVVDPVSGQENLDQLEDERQFEPQEVERAVTSPDSNRKIIEEVKKRALDHEQRYGRFPKILIFAANDLPHVSHADQLVRICRDAFGRGDGFVSKITGRVDRPLQRIREFRNRPDPAIAVSVDLMSTGVDIPDLEFIIFLRPVQSRILFEQMLGRGTRKGEKYPDKSHFSVFDCFGGTLLERFKNATMKLLLDKEFQKLLVDYPRPPKRFFVAEENEDTVTSEWMVRDGSGNELKPDDYLAAFSRFVKENPEQIEAIQILLDRPRDWNTKALVELKDKLRKSRERFTPDLLQKAHAARYRKSLVDIISMVKHAAAEQEPLLTSEERVDRALAALTSGKSFSPQQRQWLDRIRRHLVENLTVGPEDFDSLPVFADFGGWSKANKDFGGKLLELITDVNSAVAA